MPQDIVRSLGKPLAAGNRGREMRQALSEELTVPRTPAPFAEYEKVELPSLGTLGRAGCGAVSEIVMLVLGRP